MPRPDLDAIAARVAAATPGPWEDDVTEEDGDLVIRFPDNGVWYFGNMETSTGRDHADTAFIAHARADIPALLAYIAELEARPVVNMATIEQELAYRVRKRR